MTDKLKALARDFGRRKGMSYHAALNHLRAQAQKKVRVEKGEPSHEGSKKTPPR